MFISNDNKGFCLKFENGIVSQYNGVEVITVLIEISESLLRKVEMYQLLLRC